MASPPPGRRRQNLNLEVDQNEDVLQGRQKWVGEEQDETMINFYSPHLSKRVAKIKKPFQKKLSTAVRSFDSLDSVATSKRVQQLSPVKFRSRNLLNPVSFMKDPARMSTTTYSSRTTAATASPLGSPIKPLKAEPSCEICGSTNIVLMPQCKYCGSLRQLSTHLSKVKKLGMNFVQKDPTASATDMLEYILGIIPSSSKANSIISTSNLDDDDDNNTAQADNESSKKSSAPSDTIEKISAAAVRHSSSSSSDSEDDRTTIPKRRPISTKVPKATASTKQNQRRKMTTSLSFNSGHGRSFHGGSSSIQETVEFKKSTNTAPPAVPQSTIVWEEPNSDNNSITTSSFICDTIYRVQNETKDQEAPTQGLYESELKQDFFKAMANLFFVRDTTEVTEARWDKRDGVLELLKNMNLDDVVSVVDDYRGWLASKKGVDKSTILCNTSGSSIAATEESHDDEAVTDTSLYESNNTSYDAAIKAEELQDEGLKNFRISVAGTTFIVDQDYILRNEKPVDLKRLLEMTQPAREYYLLANADRRLKFLNSSPAQQLTLVRRQYRISTIDRARLLTALAVKGEYLTSEEKLGVVSCDPDLINLQFDVWKVQYVRTRHSMNTRGSPPPSDACYILPAKAVVNSLDNLPQRWNDLLSIKPKKVIVMTLRSVHSLILQIYWKKLSSGNTQDSMLSYVDQFMTSKFGEATMFENRMISLIKAFQKYYLVDKWCQHFLRFCHLLNGDPLPASCLSFYLSALNSLSLTSVNDEALLRSYKFKKRRHGSLLQPIYYSKSIVVLGTICEELRLDVTRWRNALVEKRRIGTLKSTNASALYYSRQAAAEDNGGNHHNHQYRLLPEKLNVVELSDFMGILVEIWEYQNKSKELYLRRMFHSYDGGKRDTLNFDSFALFLNSSSSTTYKFKDEDEKAMMGTLYRKCVLHSKTKVVDVDSFIRGALDCPLILRKLGLAPPLRNTKVCELIAINRIVVKLRKFLRERRKSGSLLILRQQSTASSSSAAVTTIDEEQEANDDEVVTTYDEKNGTL